MLAVLTVNSTVAASGLAGSTTMVPGEVGEAAAHLAHQVADLEARLGVVRVDHARVGGETGEAASRTAAAVRASLRIICVLLDCGGGPSAGPR